MGKDFYTKEEVEKILGDCGEEWYRVYNKKFRNVIKNCFECTDEEVRLWILEIFEVTKNAIGQPVPNESEPRHWMIECHMGENGDGKWTKYFQDMVTVTKHLEDWFDHVYMVKWDFDVDDDVSYPIIGVSHPKFNIEEK